MFLIVNTSTGAVRPAPKPTTDIGVQDDTLARDEIIIDSTSQAYDPVQKRVVSISPVSIRHPIKRLRSIESRIAMLEADLAQQADSLLGFAATIEYLCQTHGKTLPVAIEEARARIRKMQAEPQEPEAGEAEA